MEKTYLGDAAYAEFSEEYRGVTLTTENGICATNSIVLEPEVLIALVKFCKQIEGYDDLIQGALR